MVINVKILIVDDSLMIRRKIECCIAFKSTQEIIQAEDGEEAVRLFDLVQPDLVTMDLTMPKMEGAECVKRMVAINNASKILVVSALTDKAIALEAIRHGANGFLTKPFEDKELDDALHKLYLV